MKFRIIIILFVLSISCSIATASTSSQLNTISRLENKIISFIESTPLMLILHPIEAWRVSEFEYATGEADRLTQEGNKRELIQAGIIPDERVLSKEDKIKKVSTIPISKSASSLIESSTIGWYRGIAFLTHSAIVFYGLLLAVFVFLIARAVRHRS